MLNIWSRVVFTSFAIVMFVGCGNPGHNRTSIKIVAPDTVRDYPTCRIRTWKIGERWISIGDGYADKAGYYAIRIDNGAIISVNVNNSIVEISEVYQGMDLVVSLDSKEGGIRIHDLKDDLFTVYINSTSDGLGVVQ